MLKQDVYDEYGTASSIAIKIGLSEHSIYKWGKVVPKKYALMLEQISNGRLKVNENFYDQHWNIKKEYLY